jgi:hypothetical protein
MLIVCCRSTILFFFWVHKHNIVLLPLLINAQSRRVQRVLERSDRIRHQNFSACVFACVHACVFPSDKVNELNINIKTKF